MANTQKVLADSAQEAVTEELRDTTWAVYPGFYRYSPTRSGGLCAEVFGAKLRHRVRYQPLVAATALVLEFSELGGDDIEVDAWIDWVERNGVLGLNKDPQTHMGWDRGGGKETLDGFREEARRVHWVLSLYGAATALDEPDIAAIAAIDKEADMGYLPAYTLEKPGMAREFALRLAGTLVQERLATEAFPQLYQTQEGHRSAWGFRSLLGAIYLQAMFLLTATGKVRYCLGPNCPEIIDFDLPEQPAVSGLNKNDRSKGYRTRKDKVYCSKKCGMRYRRLHGLA